MEEEEEEEESMTRKRIRGQPGPASGGMVGGAADLTAGSAAAADVTESAKRPRPNLASTTGSPPGAAVASVAAARSAALDASLVSSASQAPHELLSAEKADPIICSRIKSNVWGVLLGGFPRIIMEVVQQRVDNDCGSSSGGSGSDGDSDGGSDDDSHVSKYVRIATWEVELVDITGLDDSLPINKVLDAIETVCAEQLSRTVLRVEALDAEVGISVCSVQRDDPFCCTLFALPLESCVVLSGLLNEDEAWIMNYDALYLIRGDDEAQLLLSWDAEMLLKCFKEIDLYDHGYSLDEGASRAIMGVVEFIAERSAMTNDGVNFFASLKEVPTIFEYQAFLSRPVV